MNTSSIYHFVKITQIKNIVLVTMNALAPKRAFNLKMLAKLSFESGCFKSRAERQWCLTHQHPKGSRTHQREAGGGSCRGQYSNTE